MGRDEAGFQSKLGAYDSGSESPSATRGEADDAETEPESSGVFRVAVKDSATTANSAVADWVSYAGEMFTYESRQTAEEHAGALGEQGGAPLSIQTAAPNDDSAADAYLVSDPDRNVSAPANPGSASLAFDVEANQFGAIGEALITTPATNPPALTYYIEEDLDLEEEVRVRIQPGTAVSKAAVSGAATQYTEHTWLPDCVAVAERASTGGEIARYWCEVKSGDGSFEREQSAVMEAKAAAPGSTVLEVRVLLEDLPDSYEVRFEEVSPPDDAPEQSTVEVGDPTDDAEIL